MKTVITSKNNPIVKEAAFLKEKKGRVRTGLFFVEGEKMTAEYQGYLDQEAALSAQIAKSQQEPLVC